MNYFVSRLLASSLIAAPSAALAHTGHDHTGGFVYGFVHPVGGLDHLLAMIAVGVLAYQIGGRALWLLPATFVAVMSIGWAAGVLGLRLPFVEIGIAVSVIVMGAAIALGIKAPLALAVAIAGVFAIFHGFAHGTEMPQSGSAATYALGFVAATAMLHLFGIGLGIFIANLSRGYGDILFRVAGCAVAVAGAVILVQTV